MRQGGVFLVLILVLILEVHGFGSHKKEKVLVRHVYFKKWAQHFSYTILILKVIWFEGHKKGEVLVWYVYFKNWANTTYSLGSLLVWKSQERSSSSLVCLFQEVNRLFWLFWFYSDNLSRLRFFEALGILKVYGFGSRKKGIIPVTSICDPF